MQCNTIIIVANDYDDEEVQEAVGILADRYQMRRVIILKNLNNLSSLDVIDQNPDMYATGKCGVYFISHGSATKGCMRTNADDVARLILALYEKNLPVIKICVLACMAVHFEKTDTKSIAVQVLNMPKDKDNDCYVQNICVALVNTVPLDKLAGLMIAGYMTPVWIFKKDGRVDSNSKKGETTTSKRNELVSRCLEGAGSKVYKNMFLDPMRPTIKTETGLIELTPDTKNALTAYIARKIIFVFKDNAWRMGSLIDYTDSKELKSALGVLLI